MFLFLKKTWKIGLSILFGVAVLLFWGSVYPAHISYQEQFQLFLFDADYWWERIVVPGGLADYIAEYLTQFYYHVWAGACILAFLYVLLQRLVWKLAKEQGAADVYYPLSFLPIIVLWHFMGDENAMLSLVVALLLALSASCGFEREVAACGIHSDSPSAALLDSGCGTLHLYGLGDCTRVPVES